VPVTLDACQNGLLRYFRKVCLLLSDNLHPLRPFLKNWLWEHGRIGTRYLDRSTGDVKFDEGKKAGFAAALSFYVSLDKEASAATQSPPVIHEAALAKFLNAAQFGQPSDAGSVTDVQRAVQECVEIALRCAYQELAIKAHGFYSQEGMFDEEIRDAIFADVRKTYLPLRQQMALYDFSVVYGFPSPLFICESPLIDWRTHAGQPKPFVSMALAPYALLVGAPSAKTSRAAPVVWTKAAVMGPFKEHNVWMAQQAKQWLVATSDSELEAVQD
jgi:hypothetical protein